MGKVISIQKGKAKKAAPKKAAKAAKKTRKDLSSRPASLSQAKPAKTNVEVVETNTEKLSATDARDRCKAIYGLERSIERKQAVYDSAKGKASVAKRALIDAKSALAQEISEQRLGPGPLFPADGGK